MRRVTSRCFRAMGQRDVTELELVARSEITNLKSLFKRGAAAMGWHTPTGLKFGQSRLNDLLVWLYLMAKIDPSENLDIIDHTNTLYLTY